MAIQPSSTKSKSEHRYETYRFADKDPIIDQLRTCQKDSGMSWSQISVKSNVANTTLYNWDHGNTKRPQFATIVATARAMGYDAIDLRGGKPKLRKVKFGNGHGT